jgi:Ethanolamine utilization protein EutJ (predicted chaperonin)
VKVVGIDLGTSNTVLAHADAGQEQPAVEVLPIPQLVAAGTVDTRPGLPSFVYLAPTSEQPLALPWDAKRTFAVGEYARARGADAPTRVVASAKSWLCHTGIDRRTAALPAGSTDVEELEKVSPVEASYRYLEHLSEAFAAALGSQLGDAEVVLTVPASFDAAARELTVEAAFAAGLENVTLLEEPQAALYAWIAARGDAWRKELAPGDVVLVVDVGGGTTDFSAIRAIEVDGSLELERVAVGDHILLGGDNMDLALAYGVRARLEAEGKQLDAWQSQALVFACRSAKEKLLESDRVKSVPVVVGARGSKLVGGSIRTELLHDDVVRAIVDGFFPKVASDARPKVRPRGGLTQLGLPYAHDPQVTAHLAAFLAKHGDGSRPLLPTRILFNGGVLEAKAIRERLGDTIAAWCKEHGAPAPVILSSGDLHLAVARGAAVYGLVRHGKGLRIRGGTARAYYVGIESPAPAVPGVEPPVTALCVAPLGMEEGTSAELPQAELGLVVGEEVSFRFFGSTVRKGDGAGTALERWKDGELEELEAVHVSLPATGRSAGDVVPVTLRSEVTAIGTLLLEAVPKKPLEPRERWKIELTVRSPEGS